MMEGEQPHYVVSPSVISARVILRAQMQVDNAGASPTKNFGLFFYG
jgi:hypothetical protein